MARNEHSRAAPAEAPEPQDAPSGNAPTATEAKPEAQPKQAAKRPPYAVADGKALTCNRGVLGPGEEITPRDLSDSDAAGRKQLDELASKGYVVKSG